MSKAKRGRGRPTDYKEEYNLQAYKLTLLGFTDKDMADFWGVTEQTINNWKNEHPNFFESITRGKEFADTEVVESLYNRAKGYTVKRIEYEMNQDEDGTQSQRVKKIIKQEVAPDTQAIQFWLKNRQPSKWRDKKELEIESESPIVLINDIKPADIKGDSDEKAD
jgi:hypothetical protein